MPFARPGIEPVLKLSQVGIRDQSPISFLRIHTTHESIAILIRPPLLRAVCVSEETFHAEFFFDLRVTQVLGTAITRERLSDIRWHLCKPFNDDAVGFRDAAVFHLAEQYDAGNTLVDALYAVGALSRYDGVILKVAELLPLLHGLRPILDRGQRRPFSFLRLSEAFCLSSCVTAREIPSQVFASVLYLSVAAAMHLCVYELVYSFV